jgi:hypothetical protein
VLFLIESSASMAEGSRLEGIDRFVAGMRSVLAGSDQAEVGERIDIQATRLPPWTREHHDEQYPRHLPTHPLSRSLTKAAHSGESG